MILKVFLFVCGLYFVPFSLHRPRSRKRQIGRRRNNHIDTQHDLYQMLPCISLNKFSFSELLYLFWCKVASPNFKFYEWLILSCLDVYTFWLNAANVRISRSSLWSPDFPTPTNVVLQTLQTLQTHTNTFLLFFLNNFFWLFCNNIVFFVFCQFLLVFCVLFCDVFVVWILCNVWITST